MAKHTPKNAPKKKAPAKPARKTPPTVEPWLIGTPDKEMGEEMILGLLDVIVALDADVQVVSKLLGVDLSKNPSLQTYREWPEERKAQWAISLSGPFWGGQWGANLQLKSYYYKYGNCSVSVNPRP